MRINITGRLAGYSYAEGEQDIPKEHAQLFLDAEKANLPEADYPIHQGAGYYELSNGERVRGKEKAIEAEQEI